MCQNHQTFISCSLVHNFHMCNNNYIAIYTQRTLLDMNISYFPNQHYWFPLLENLGTCKLSCLKHCQETFCTYYFQEKFHALDKQIQHLINLSFVMIFVAVFFSVFCSVLVTDCCYLFFCFYSYKTFLLRVPILMDHMHTPQTFGVQTRQRWSLFSLRNNTF